ncbi:hypothetical protein J1605_002358 [Eschrichtius robustus]|uniref:Uncharacterized protein n=1 Tax=Eschrichtius robustus TaxID=9764 RepID=A0AB34HRX0_ESCRO|nr:hypothetical protein J1605_002358 [Eschrichtius robustus]
MGVEGCTKCIKYLLFVFNFVFWVSPEPRVGGRSPSLAGRAPLGPAKGAQPGRQVAGPPVCAERVTPGPRLCALSTPGPGLLWGPLARRARRPGGVRWGHGGRKSSSPARAGETVQVLHQGHGIPAGGVARELPGEVTGAQGLLLEQLRMSRGACRCFLARPARVGDLGRPGAGERPV